MQPNITGDREMDEWLNIFLEVVPRFTTAAEEHMRVHTEDAVSL